MKIIAHTEQDHRFKSFWCSPIDYHFPFVVGHHHLQHWHTYTHTNNQTLVLLQMSHPPQADNYSVSDGVMWRVGCRTDQGRGGVGKREWSSTMIHHHSTQHTPLPRQHARSSPPPAVWQHAREWQGDTVSFFMCCSSTPLQSNCEKHLCFTTTHEPLTGRRRGKEEPQSDINHLPVDNCCQMLIAFWLSSNALFHCLCYWQHMLGVYTEMYK